MALILNFYAPKIIPGTAESSDYKFCTLIDDVKY